MGAGYNKSPRLPGHSFPSSYRDSTFLSILAVLCCPQQYCFLDNFQPHVHADSLHILLKVEANRRERYPANSIVGDSKDTEESTVPIIIIINIIIIIIIINNDLKWNVYIIYNYPPKGR